MHIFLQKCLCFCKTWIMFLSLKHCFVFPYRLEDHVEKSSNMDDLEKHNLSDVIKVTLAKWLFIDNYQLQYCANTMSWNYIGVLDQLDIMWNQKIITKWMLTALSWSLPAMSVLCVSTNEELTNVATLFMVIYLL